MAYTAGEIIEDVLHRVNDEEKKLSGTWLLHLLNMAQTDFARRTKYWSSQSEIKLDTRFNAFILPLTALEIRNVRYSLDSNTYSVLTPMNPNEIEFYSKKILFALGDGQTYWRADRMPEKEGWTKIVEDNSIYASIEGTLENGQVDIDLKSDGVCPIGEYLLWDKDFVFDENKGWGVSGSFVVPTICQPAGTTAQNEIFTLYSGDIGTTGDIWLKLIIKNTGVGNGVTISGIGDDMVCKSGDTAVFKLTGYQDEATYILENFTTGVSVSHAVKRLPTQTQKPSRIRFGGLFISELAR